MSFGWFGSSSQEQSNLQDESASSSPEPFAPTIILDHLVEKIKTDPSIVQSTQPQYIIPEGSEHGRSFAERALSKIGYAVGIGYGFGMIRGLLSGGWTKEAGKMKMTKAMTDLNKFGASHSQTFGTAMLLYSALEYGISSAGWDDDKYEETRSITAGTITGVLYRMPTLNLAKIGKGGLIGFACALTYEAIPILFMEDYRDKRRAMLGV